MIKRLSRTVGWPTCRTIICAGLAALVLLAFNPTAVSAQSRIAGVVKDTTGSVLPGVTVEASSPVLIEKVRSVVTDGQGAYQIADLRPGVYVITFTLPGFSTVKRDGIDLPASFTATVNAELRVGQVQETLTVTGEAPLVDTHAVTRQKTIGQADLEELPILTRDSAAYVATIPGVTGVNLGGLAFTQKSVAIHGGNGGEAFVGIDGFTTSQAAAVGGGGTTYYMNQASVQEVAVKLDGAGAETQMGGIYSNVIPKEGGNLYSGYFYTGYTSNGWVASNVTDELRAKGFTDSGLKKAWDYTPALGGPLLKDRLWFYTAFRMSGLHQYMPNLYVNLTPTGWAYTPDYTRPAWVKQTDGNAGLRLTWAASPRNKFSAFTDWQPHTVYNRNFSSLTSLEATTWTPFQPNVYATGVWKSPVNNRVLLEAGFGTMFVNYTPRRDTLREWGGLRDEMPAQDYVTVSKLESSTGIRFGSPNPAGGTAYGNNVYVHRNIRASAAYITGTHAFKFGFADLWGYSFVDTNTNLGYSVTLLNGRPNQIQEFAEPNGRWQNTKADLGVYATDEWTMKRLTINLGVRYDYYDAYIPPQSLPAGNYFAARELAGIDDVIAYKDISPRFGAVYDLFGDGKTALKASFGRYVVGVALNQVIPFNPVSTSVLTVNRQWNDANSNFVPDCDLRNPLVNGECAQISNLNFGLSNPAATKTDPAVVHGWGSRDFSWASSVEIERELRSGVSVSAGYFRRVNTNRSVTDNLSVTPADYDAFCIAAPLNPRLPGGGGYQVCGLYDIKPALFGQSENLVTLVDKFGKQGQVYNGIDFTSAVRLPRGRVAGGVSFGRTENDSCFVIDSPQRLQFCDVITPFQPNIRLSGSYSLPWGITTGVVFSNLPGPQITASYQASNAEIRPTLGRNVSAGANALTTVALIQPGTLFADRQQQLDLRVGKRFKVGKARLDGFLDFQNLLNSTATQTLNTAYGSGVNWLDPTQIQNPRYMRVNLTVDY